MSRPAHQRPPLHVLVATGGPELDALTSATIAALRQRGVSIRTTHAWDGLGQELIGHLPDLVVIDAYPRSTADGAAAAQLVRSSLQAGLILVIDSGSTTEMLAAFEAGVDDCVVRPYEVEVLLARILAVARRVNPDARGVWRIGRVVVDEDAHRVSVANRAVELTPTEFSLLALLCRTPGRVVSKERLLNDIWGYDHFALNLVEVHVSSLRRKLEAEGSNIIQTVRGAGYAARGDF